MTRVNRRLLLFLAVSLWLAGGSLSSCTSLKTSQGAPCLQDTDCWGGLKCLEEKCTQGSTEISTKDAGTTECTPGKSEACYTGKAGTEGVGECKTGTRTCTTAGTWGTCQGQVIPKDEDCNGKDDDCNGKVDDNLSTQDCYPDGVAGCPTDKDGNPMDCVGTCKRGTSTCKDGKWGECVGAIKPKDKECVITEDYDCDGVLETTCGNSFCPQTCTVNQECQLAACLLKRYCIGGTCKRKCPATCTNNADCTNCEQGKTCVNGTCGTASQCNSCVSKTDCSTCGNKTDCVNGTCTDPPGQCPASCTQDADCMACPRSRSKCVNGKCGECVGDSDCGQGKRCHTPPGVQGAPSFCTCTCTPGQGCSNCGNYTVCSREGFCLPPKP